MSDVSAECALLISEQTFQEQACIGRNTLLREQRTYPFLDLAKRRRPQRKRLLNRRCPRPLSSNHGCPLIQKPSESATVMLRGNRAGQHSIRINDQFRVCFVWTLEGPKDVEIVDYH